MTENKYVISTEAEKSLQYDRNTVEMTENKYVILTEAEKSQQYNLSRRITTTEELWNLHTKI